MIMTLCQENGTLSRTILNNALTLKTGICYRSPMLTRMLAHTQTAIATPTAVIIEKA